jgi:DHA1 family inner membrane transport protein
VLREPQLLLGLLLTVFAFGGVFTAFTFITPMLQQLAGFSPRAVTAILFLFGLGLTLGNAIGGRLADWKLMPSMVAILIALVLVELLMSATITLPAAAVFAVFAWGVAAFAAVPGLQTQVVNRAQDAPTLASTLNVSAFNVGNAAGAWLGSSLIAANLPLRLLPVAAAATATAAIGIAVLIIAMDRRSRQVALRFAPRPE